MLVLLSWLRSPRSRSQLAFSRAELGALFLAVLIGAVVAGDGRSNWYKGVQLIVVYVGIALMFYFVPAASSTVSSAESRAACSNRASASRKCSLA